MMNSLELGKKVIKEKIPIKPNIKPTPPNIKATGKPLNNNSASARNIRTGNIVTISI